LVDKLKHLDILHVRGTDVRTTAYSKWYGWIVRHNLKKAKKVLYASPDLKPHLWLRRDAEYFPGCIDMKLFSTKQNYSDVPKAVYWVKWYETLPQFLVDALRKYGVPLTIYHNYCFSHSAMPNILKKHDILIDRFSIPSLSMTCKEAMSCGLATVDFRHINSFEQQIKKLCEPSNVKRVGRRNVRYIQDNFELSQAVRRLTRIYESVKCQC
jgi:hypothetical protein